MKNYYQIHIMYPEPLSSDVIAKIDNYLGANLSNRIKVDKNNNQIGSIIVSVDDSGNPEFDELSDLLLCLDGTYCQPFFGYPNDDWSNAITDECGKEVWDLLDNCEVNEPTH